MTTWAKIKFFYDSIPGRTGSEITATTAAAGSYVDNIFNTLEVNRWTAADATDPHYITVDLRSDLGYQARPADYVAFIGHNLGSINATVVLQYSTDNFVSDINDAFAPEAVQTDAAYLKEFTSPGAKRYWRLRITGHTLAPHLTVCLWGMKTELDYATASFDPYEEEVSANVNMSQGGYVTGIHRRYSERSLRLKFNDSDAALYQLVKGWWDVSGTGNFFVAWDTAGSPSDIYLMRPDLRFSNPFGGGGSTRDITINLRGRKE